MRADAMDRRALLKPGEQTVQRKHTNLVLTHSASIPNVNVILKKHYNILMQSNRLKDVFPEPPRAVYRRSRNLRDILTSSKVTTPVHVGCHPCNKTRCKVCPQMTTSQIVKSAASNFTLRIKGNFDCDTSNVIYLLECSTCNLQYIGQTETPFRLRFNNHKSHVLGLPSLPLSKHVATPGHSFDNLTATILESGFKSHYEREVRESFLIHKFNAIASGINENPGRLTFLPVKEIN